MIVTAGIDVGSSAIKVAVVRSDGPAATVAATGVGRIRRRDPRQVLGTVFEAACAEAGVTRADLAYIATTGEGELVEFRRGHFYSMTAHARGALHLRPASRAVLDIGALHGRAIRMDPRGRVLDYRMTSQCASGSGQFLENIARYLGVTVEEVGPLSAAAPQASKVSGICAVLAETDVINMVARGHATADILRGIHQSMANRFVRLLASARAEGEVCVTGGLAADVGLAAEMAAEVTRQRVPVALATHPQAVYAGAIGAALWGAFRHVRLAQAAEPALAGAGR